MNTSTSTYTRTVVGVFDETASAQRAIDGLMAAGFSRESVEMSRTNNQSNVTSANREHEGGISGFFHRLFGTENDDDRNTYEEAVNRGGVVVCVYTDEEDQDKAAEVLNSNGAVDIDQKRTSWRGEKTSTGTKTGTADTRSIPVVQEELRVGKRPVQRGAVRVYNRVREQPVEQQVELREEQVRVERRNADRPATAADLQNRDEVIEFTEMAEEPVVEKRARVVEEVVVGKETTTRTQTIRDNVRQTDVNVQRTGAAEDNDRDFRNDFAGRFQSVPSAKYETYAPAYRYGYENASDERYRGRSWDEIEPTLRSDFERRNPNSKWEQMKGAVRYGWEKVTGQTR